MTSNWIGIAISVVVMLGGTAVNLFIIGRFVGEWSEAMKNLATTLAKVEERVESVAEEGAMTAGKLSLVDQRLLTTEQATSKFWEMRDEFTAMRVTVEQEGKHARDKLDSVARSISVVERQMANLVSTSRTGITVLPTTDGN